MMMMMDGQQEPPIAQLSSTYPTAPMDFGKLIDPNEVLIMSLETQGIERLYSLAPTQPEPTSTSTEKQPHEETPTTEEERKQEEAIEATEKKSEESSSKMTSTSSSAICTHAINTNNHKRELKKLNHSILVAYLDLLDILVHAPNTQIEIEQPPLPVQQQSTGEDSAAAAATEQPPPNVILKTVREQKLGDIELLFINMHHLINELRPHQARDTLRCILEMQRQQRIEMAAKFKEHLLKIVDLLHNCIQSIEPKNLDKNLTNELESLFLNASNLTNSLDELSRKKKPQQTIEECNNNNNEQQKKATNGYLCDHDGDVEMKSDSGDDEDNVDSVIKMKKKNENDEEQEARKHVVSSSSNRLITSSAGLNKNCDFRDLVLCDLIDEEFVTTSTITIENEF